MRPEMAEPVSNPDQQEEQTLALDPERQFDALVEGGATFEDLADAAEVLEAPDAADKLEDLPTRDTLELVHEMENEKAAEALAHMEAPLGATVLLDLDPGEAAELLGLMEPDDAADLLQELPDDKTTELLGRMKPKVAAALGKLALYDKETAGGMMTTDIMVVRGSHTIGQAIESIKRSPSNENQLDIYAVDDDRRLLGSISLRDVLVLDNDRLVRDHIDESLDVLTTDIDREDVAKAFERYDYLTMPVVDSERRVLGMVTIDDVVDIIEHEFSEDPLVQVGAGAREAAYSSIGAKFRGRIGWLLLNLGLAAMAAAVIAVFDDFIQAIPILAAVFPIIANQSGNAGHQSLAVTLRGMALGQVRRDLVMKLLAREMLAGVGTGVVVGIVFAAVLALLHPLVPELNWRLGVIAGVSLAGAMPAACFVGTGIPLLLDKLGKDPAAASSIFLTMLTDFMAYGLFLGLAIGARAWLLPDAAG